MRKKRDRESRRNGSFCIRKSWKKTRCFAFIVICLAQLLSRIKLTRAHTHISVLSKWQSLVSETNRLISPLGCNIFGTLPFFDKTRQRFAVCFTVLSYIMWSNLNALQLPFSFLLFTHFFDPIFSFPNCVCVYVYIYRERERAMETYPFLFCFVEHDPHSFRLWIEMSNEKSNASFIARSTIQLLHSCGYWICVCSKVCMYLVFFSSFWFGWLVGWFTECVGGLFFLDKATIQPMRIGICPSTYCVIHFSTHFSALWIFLLLLR